MKLNDWN